MLDKPTEHRGLRRATFWFIGRFLPLLAGALAIFFFAALIVNLDQDTTPITNATFAAVATLAALCLSAARGAQGYASTRYARAGEGFLLAALLVLLASVLRYGAMRLHENLVSYPSAQVAFIRGCGGLVTVLFGMAMWSVVSSVRHLAAALEARSLEFVATLRTERAASENDEAAVPERGEARPL